MKKPELEGSYTLDGKRLINSKTILELGNRFRAKKGQARRFIGWIDTTKPAEEQYNYISSLYAVHSKKNSYTLEHKGKYYILTVVGLNKVEIKPQELEPILEYHQEKAGVA